ncbi:MAG: hypothetical protein BWK79_02500 [Beggiatoa sp. IS2]|nr:MAG: hypothetical protein BWK79_02500 [Beggiatoa sp. IS2]
MRVTFIWLNLAVITATLLTGCIGDDMSDLQKYVGEMRARKNPHVDDPPKYEMAPPFYYEAESQRDPFAPFDTVAEGPRIPVERLLDAEQQSNKPCPQPDRNRVRVGLELLPLDSLRMVGTLKDQDNVLWALVITSDGTIYRVKSGDYMGLNYGQIISITEAKVELTELYSDGKGCFVEQITPLALFESK